MTGTISANGLSGPGGVSFVPGTVVPPNGAIVTSGSTVTLAKSDNTGNLAQVTANVSSGSLTDVALPATYGVLQDGGTSINCAQYDNSGSVAVIPHVSANTPSVQLANATTRIVVDALPTSVKNVSGSVSATGTIGISGGALTGITLAASTSLVSNGTALTVPVTGTYSTTITPQVNASGVITGFALS
jgi:hypothetical protein